MNIEIPKNQLLANLPPKVELILFLIKSELKNAKFTNDLNRQAQLVEDIDTTNDREVMEQAFNFYVDLVVKKGGWMRMQKRP